MNDILMEPRSKGDHGKHVSYGSLFLMVSGIYGTTPIIAAWLSNNSEPYYRRATSIALGFVATNSVRLVHNSCSYPRCHAYRFSGWYFEYLAVPY